MQKRTKIVATLGPATDEKKVLRKMIRAGLDVARLNFSHGDADEHRSRAKRLRAAAKKCGRNIGVMGDL
ncbi:MAG: pyruvate kinase, partial [Gammaproteobacteria bacterium]|nr:pyruvate kinase [Gammaproteobacteria bacterium]